MKYQCTMCNCIYDPAAGEPPEIKPGTAFKDLPRWLGMSFVRYLW